MTTDIEKPVGENCETHVTRILRRAVAALQRYLEKRRSRLKLWEMTEDQLRDIGVRRTEGGIVTLTCEET